MDMQDMIRLGINAFKESRVAPIEGKMVKYDFRWFGHVRRRLLKVPVRRADPMESSSISSDMERP